MWFNPWVWKIPWRREWLPSLVFWPRDVHVLYSPWGCKEFNTTEQLSLHFRGCCMLILFLIFVLQYLTLIPITAQKNNQRELPYHFAFPSAMYEGFGFSPFIPSFDVDAGFFFFFFFWHFTILALLIGVEYKVAFFLKLYLFPLYWLSVAEHGLLWAVMWGLLLMVTSLVAEHRLWSLWAQ